MLQKVYEIIHNKSRGYLCPSEQIKPMHGSFLDEMKKAHP